MLTRALDGYLAVRRAAGFELTVDEGLLRNFTRFATARSDTHVRRQTAIAWATAAPSPSQRERRLGMVRRFVDHARAEDPAHAPVPRLFESRFSGDAVDERSLCQAITTAETMIWFRSASA